MHEIKRMVMKLPQSYLDLMNQIFEIEKKVALLNVENSIHRNLSKIKRILEEELFRYSTSSTIGLSYHNPIGEVYTDTRTDCEATISGEVVDNLKIIEVIKPIIYYSYTENERLYKAIVQQAVVVVQSTNV